MVRMDHRWLCLSNYASRHSMLRWYEVESRNLFSEEKLLVFFLKKIRNHVVLCLTGQIQAYKCEHCIVFEVLPKAKGEYRSKLSSLICLEIINESHLTLAITYTATKVKVLNTKENNTPTLFYLNFWFVLLLYHHSFSNLLVWATLLCPLSPGHVSTLIQINFASPPPPILGDRQRVKFYCLEQH